MNDVKKERNFVTVGKAAVFTGLDPQTITKYQTDYPSSRAQVLLENIRDL